MDIWQRLAESRIREAMESGDFDDLPGAGEPVDLDDLAGVPAQLRVATIVMRNAGLVPEQAQLWSELQRTREAMAAAADREERDALMRRFTELELRFNLARARDARFLGP